MAPVPRIIENIDVLRAERVSELLSIFSPIALYNKKIKVFSPSSGGNFIFGISDGHETGINYTEWRFQTIAENLKGNYHEKWISLGKGRYFLERSYFHLYLFDNESGQEVEYVLLHCDACEPDDSPHAQYKQSPHLHVEIAQQPIPKAHLALYNGRVSDILSGLKPFNSALKETIEMLDSQILR